MEKHERHLEPITREALANFRVVVITGPRQAGKTTLVRRTLGGAGTFAPLDHEATLQAALTDPTGFALFGEPPRAFDEIHLGGDPLIRAIKRAVDDDWSRGQFLLTGSATSSQSPPSPSRSPVALRSWNSGHSLRGKSTETPTGSSNRPS